MFFQAIYFLFVNKIKISLITVITILICLNYWTKSKYYKLASKLPGPYLNIPYIGSLTFILKVSKGLFQAIEDGFTTYGSRYLVWSNQTPLMLTSKLKDMEFILNSPAVNDKTETFYDSLIGVLGDGLIPEHVDTWMVHRKLLTPAFKSAIVNSFVPNTYNKSANLMQRLQKASINDQIINIVHYVLVFSLDAYCVNFMDINFDGRIHELEELAKFVYRGKKAIRHRLQSVCGSTEFIYYRTKQGKEYQFVGNLLRNYLKKMIEEKRNEIKNNQGMKNDKKNKVLLLLAFNLLDEKKITPYKFEEELLTFFLAGTDTTALTVGIACIFLGMNPDIQEKLYEDVMGVLGSKSKPITLNDIIELKFVERVINETLRILPIVPQLARKIDSDITIDDITFPAGLNVVFSIINVQRNEQYWPNPLKFDPDRFLPERCAERSQFTFLPFALGPRSCIGMRYGMMVNKMVLADIVRNFRISTTYKSLEEIRLYTEITVGFEDGYSCILHPRQ